MLASKRFDFTRFGVTTRTMSKLGMACSMFAVLVLATGCPTAVPPTACAVDADCDNTDLCNPQSCSADLVCVTTAVTCAMDETCVAGACVGTCTDDAGCDDGMFCNGTETCVAGACVAGTAVDCDDMVNCTTDACDDTAGACTNTAVVCTGIELCDEATGTCIAPPCTLDSECDDTNLCTTDSCDMATGTCVNAAVTCDDADACTTDSCDATDGSCVNTAVVCAAGEVCDSTGTCVAGATCMVDADCTNTDFCDGTESCDLTDPANGVCTSTGNPCAATETCNEDTDTCDNNNASETFTLTLGTDTLTGGDGDDFFDGQREVSGGVQFQTLNNADSINGGAGTDRLSVQLQGGNTTTPSSLASIETLQVEVATNNAETINAVNADSIATVTNSSPSNTLTITNLQSAPSALNVANAAFATTLTCANTALAGTADAITIAVSSTTAGVVTVGPTSGTNGYETVTIESNGGSANVVADVIDGGTTMTTVNLTGAQDLTVTAALDPEVTTINGSTASGKLVIDATAATGNVTFTGGTNDDSFDISGTYSTSDVIDGGMGTNTLILTANEMDTPAVVQTNVTNITTLKTDTITSGSINAKWFAATNLFINAGMATGDTMTVPTGGTITVDTVNPAGSNTLAVEVDTTADVLNLVLDGIAWTTNISAATFETVNIASNTAANSIGGTLALTATAQSDVVNVTGSAAMTFTGQVTADILNCSTATGVITTTGGFADDVVITGGTGNDSLRGSSAADIISGGDGADTIRGDGGADTLTGGAGNDTFNGDNGDTDEYLTIKDTITDFDAATSTTTNDVFVYDISSIEATTGVTDLVDTSANSSAAADGTLVVLASDGATVANADVVAIIGDYADAAAALAAKTSWTITYGASLTDNDAFLVAYTSGTSVRIAVAVSSATVTSSDGIDILVDIAILQNTTLTTFDSGDFTAQ